VPAKGSDSLMFTDLQELPFYTSKQSDALLTIEEEADDHEEERLLSLPWSRHRPMQLLGTSFPQTAEEEPITKAAEEHIRAAANNQIAMEHSVVECHCTGHFKNHGASAAPLL